MKVRTVGILAAIGMLATSASVWSLTNKRSVGPESETYWAEQAETKTQTTNASSSSGTNFVLDGALRVEGRLGHEKLRADVPGETYILANVSGGSAATTGGSAPMNLAIVIDRSGSMKGKRLSNALNAA